MRNRLCRPESNKITESNYLLDQNIIFDDDSKFARQIKKIMRDEEDERKIQKLLELSSYLDQPENLKFILKLGKPALNILLKTLCEQ
jgi:hypothetical protein